MNGTTYYQRNKDMIIKRAKDYYQNDKESILAFFQKCLRII